jgi:nitroreductase
MRKFEAIQGHFMNATSREAAVELDRLIRSRRAIRAFRPDPVPRALLTEILDAARYAPSNYNSQPWRVHVLTGERKRRLGEALHQAYVAKSEPPFSPFPEPAPLDCTTRVDDFRARYYRALNIGRTDMAARERQTGRNLLFFDAPVGLIFTIHGAMTRHSWLDCGLFLQSVLLGAEARGLATCPQVSFARFQPIIARLLELEPEETVTCGVSCGYAAEHEPVNRLDMPREPLDVLARWRGFDG